MKKIFALFVMFAALVFVGCSSDCPCDNNGNGGNGNGDNGGNVGNIDPALVGIWKMIASGAGVDEDIYYVFNLNGTGVYHRFDIDGVHHTTNLEWGIYNGNIYIFSDSGSVRIDAYIIKDTKFYMPSSHWIKVDKLPS